MKYAIKKLTLPLNVQIKIKFIIASSLISLIKKICKIMSK